ncbi:hypothetical protein BKM31_05735 [[Actinomadura] parvosata subsp. kistnae]|uniref:HTH tetR-type domain-containing protein n=1 Tax=[Actinomadura] parvosata subsp. kistnae TaxID=1909395 RepID=A0A1V0AIW1_9ACTN|nr:hypothetical protein BKM31_05735 [Nonomuraea sp. ATCC 55076]
METTRAAIARVAARQFLEAGYGPTTMRGIAAELGIDPSLVIHHFKSKENLLLSILGPTPTVLDALDGPRETLGRRILEALLVSVGEGSLRFFAILTQVSDSEAVRARLREVFDEALIGPLRARLPHPDADLRARLAAAALRGLLYSIAIVEDDALTADGMPALIDRYAPAVQALLD